MLFVERRNLVANNIPGLNDLFKQLYSHNIANMVPAGTKLFNMMGLSENTTVDEWIRLDNIAKENLKKYPNARLAQELKNSPLARVMEESE